MLPRGGRTCGSRRGFLVGVPCHGYLKPKLTRPRTLIFYPMSALLTIFCNILQNPLDPHSREDLGRLNVATVMIERIFSRKLHESELVHFKMVADFIVELKRLAECAIDKAWAEQRAASH